MLDVSSEKLPQKARGTVVLHSVFHTLAYSDVFDYPLTAGEVHCYLTSMSASLEEVTQALADETLFSQVEDYFCLRGREAIAETRKHRAQIAKRLWPKATRYGQIIARLPFVRMVAITGSLAMNNTDEGKDVDYMIITSPGRLWICRALILLVARFAKLEGVRLCPNYLVTTNALEFNERSLYVAHEVVQMIPLSGVAIYCEMRRLNSWTAHYLPNAAALSHDVTRTQYPSLVQRALESLLSLPFIDRLENWERERKIARLSREQAASFESYFSADVCKGHIDRHGERVVAAFAVRKELLQ